MVALPFCRIDIKASKRKDCRYPSALVTIGDHICKRRLDLGLLQREAAEIIGVDKTTIVNWEKNHAQPAICHMGGVVRFLGYSPFRECDTMAQQLLSHRKTLGITQESFARLLGVDPTTLAKWERGEREPKGRYLARVRRSLDYSAL